MSWSIICLRLKCISWLLFFYKLKSKQRDIMGDNTNKYRSLIRSADAKNDETPSSPWVWQNWPSPSWPTIITTTQCSTWWDLTQLESWLNTTLIDSIWHDLTRLDSTWLDLTQLDATWLDLYSLIDCPPWVSTYDDKKMGWPMRERERGVIFSARFWCHGTTLSWVFIHARFVNVKRGHKVAQFTSQQHLIILIRNAHNELKKFVKLQH